MTSTFALLLSLLSAVKLRQSRHCVCLHVSDSPVPAPSPPRQLLNMACAHTHTVSRGA